MTRDGGSDSSSRDGGIKGHYTWRERQKDLIRGRGAGVRDDRVVIPFSKTDLTQLNGQPSTPM